MSSAQQWACRLGTEHRVDGHLIGPKGINTKKGVCRLPCALWMTEKKERPFTGMFFKDVLVPRQWPSGKKKRQKTLKRKGRFSSFKRAENAGRKNHISLVVFREENESSGVEGVCLGLFSIAQGVKVGCWRFNQRKGLCIR